MPLPRHVSGLTCTCRRRARPSAGRRHGKLVLLRVDAAAMHAAGLAFFRTPNGVWLTEHVPVEYLASE